MSFLKTIQLFVANNPGLTNKEIAAALPEYACSMTFRQVAKLLNAKEPEFRLFLLDNHIMYRLNGTLTPYQQHIEAERFEMKTGTTNASNYAFSQARFTAKGVKWIGGLWAEHIAKGQIA